MKLTPENVAAIEGVLSDYASGMKALEVAAKYGLDHTAGGVAASDAAVRASLSSLMSTFRKLGIIDKRKKMQVKISVDEYAEFLAWKDKNTGVPASLKSVA